MGIYDRDWARAVPGPSKSVAKWPRWKVGIVAIVVTGGLTALYIAGRNERHRFPRRGYEDRLEDLDPLIVALMERDEDALADLLENDPGKVSEVLAWNHRSDLPLNLAVELGSESIVRVVLDHGAQLDAAGTAGRSALHCASSAGGIDMVRLLLDRGAKPDVVDRVGFTPLFEAAQSPSPVAVEICQLLIDRGANVNHATPDGQTALDVAKASQNLRVLAYLRQLTGQK